MPFSSRRRSRTRKRFEDEPPIVYLREADYDRERKKKGYVGSTWPASSSEYADHEAYHNLMDLRKAAKKNFRASETQAHYDFDSMTEGDEKKRRYYRSTGNLFPRQHTSLMPSADAWEGTEYSHANARADFMDKYPYSYRTVQGWKDHQGYVRAAYTDHENALRQYNWHGQYASDPHDNTRDLYGEQVVEGYQPERSRRGLPRSGYFYPEGDRYYVYTERTR